MLTNRMLVGMSVLCILLSNQSIAQSNIHTKAKVADKAVIEFVYTDNNNATGSSKSLQSSSMIESQNFVINKTIWRLDRIDIDQSALNTNLVNYSSLLSDVRSSMAKIIYVEGNGKAMFAKQGNQKEPFYFGHTSQHLSNVSLSHEVPGCTQCTKLINYERQVNGNTLTIRMQDEDQSLSDVYYLLTFIK